MPATRGGERRVVYHRSRLGQRQLSVAKQNGEKFKTTTTQCWNISRDENPIKVTKVQASWYFS